jgi:hypothetical protein
MVMKRVTVSLSIHYQKNGAAHPHGEQSDADLRRLVRLFDDFAQSFHA